MAGLTDIVEARHWEQASTSNSSSGISSRDADADDGAEHMRGGCAISVVIMQRYLNKTWKLLRSNPLQRSSLSLNEARAASK
jgi:hypothetical protein